MPHGTVHTRSNHALILKEHFKGYLARNISTIQAETRLRLPNTEEYRESRSVSVLFEFESLLLFTTLELDDSLLSA